MADPIIPPTSTIVGAAIDAIVVTMPQALAPIQNGGTWSAVPAIIEAQTDLALARVADEVKSARLRFSTGTSLRTLVASEFNLSLVPAPQAAYATLVIGRGSDTGAPGVIKGGSQFSKAANPNAFPIPVAAATYQAVQTVYMPQGAMMAFVPCVAVTPGADANVPTFSNTNVLTTLSAPFRIPPYGPTPYGIPVVDQTPLPAGTFFTIPGYGHFYVASVAFGNVNVLQLTTAGPNSTVLPPVSQPPGTIIPEGTALCLGNTQIQATTPLFDPTLSVIDCDASGGAPSLSDPGLVAAARANAVGQYGPTDGALVAGVLSQQSVQYYAFLRATGQLPFASSYVADPSWASSGLGLGTGTSWVDSVAGSVQQNQQGFGCRIRWGQVVNQLTAVSATVYLKTTEALAYTQAIDANVRAAVRAYFDGRQDWYLFRLKGLGSAIRNADPNIQQVQNVVVSDAVTGNAISEPATPGHGAWSPTLTHYYVSTSGSDQTVTTTYLPPA